MSIMDVPAGRDTSDAVWQQAYSDGENERTPSSLDPLYVSGWIHGYCGAFQASEAEAVEAYNEAKSS